MNLNYLIVELALLFLADTICSILMIYVAIAIGQLFSQHRIVAAFGAYIVISIAIQIIMSIFMALLAIGNLESLFINGELAMTTISGLINGTTVISLVLAIGFYYVTQYIMKNRLNLE